MARVEVGRFAHPSVTPDLSIIGTRGLTREDSRTFERRSIKIPDRPSGSSVEDGGRYFIDACWFYSSPILLKNIHP